MILLVSSLLHISGLQYARAGIITAKVQNQIEALKNRRTVSFSSRSAKGNLSLADPAKSVAKTTQSPKLKNKEQFRIARKNALIKMLGSRPNRRHLMIANNRANNEQ